MNLRIKELEEATSTDHNPKRDKKTVEITYSFMQMGTPIDHGLGNCKDNAGDWCMTEEIGSHAGDDMSHDEFMAICERAFKVWQDTFKYLYPWVTLKFTNLKMEK